MFLKCWQQKQRFSGTTVFKEDLSLAATVYYLSVFANYSADFTKNAQSKTFKTHFNTNTLWNLVFAISNFTRYKTLVHRARFFIAVWCVRNKVKFIYFDLLPLLFFASFMKNHHHNTFSCNKHWPLHFKWK